MIIWDTIAKNKKNDFHAPKPRLDFARQSFKHGIVL